MGLFQSISFILWIMSAFWTPRDRKTKEKDNWKISWKRKRKHFNNSPIQSLWVFISFSSGEMRRLWMSCPKWNCILKGASWKSSQSHSQPDEVKYTNQREQSNMFLKERAILIYLTWPWDKICARNLANQPMGFFSLTRDTNPGPSFSCDFSDWNSTGSYAGPRQTK